MKLSRSVIVLTLISLVSAACLIPQEMAAYVLPPTSTSTSTITNSPIPSLTPFQPQTLTAIPIGTASSTPAASLAASPTATITGTGTITLLPSSTITQTVSGLPTQKTPSRTSTIFKSQTASKTQSALTATKTRTLSVPTFTRTNGPSPTPTRSRTPGPTLTASPTVNGGQLTPGGPVSAMQLINAMNALRVANGYPALRVNSILMGTAQWTAEYMAANHLNGHIGNVSGRIAAAGYGNGATVFATENWARGFTSLSQIMSAWSDDLHMIPATNPYLTDIGAGVATGPWGPYYILHAAYAVGPTVAPSKTPTRTPSRTPTRTPSPTATPLPPTSTIPPTEPATQTPIPTEVPSDTPVPTDTQIPAGRVPGMDLFSFLRNWQTGEKPAEVFHLTIQVPVRGYNSNFEEFPRRSA